MPTGRHVAALDLQSDLLPITAPDVATITPVR